jgi:putative peptidoglycan lipid II flippase
MAVANLTSRITGFVRQVMLVGVLSVGIVNSSYTTANNLPNIVFELLLGGILSSVLIPLLIRSKKEDSDGGNEYTCKLLTIAGVALLLATIVAIVFTPALTQIYVPPEADPTVRPLVVAFSYLLLPQIFFYGLGAILGAILNSRGIFGPFAWAPVINNLIMMAVLGVYSLLPGEITLNPVRMSEPKLLALGIGTTLGIIVQAAVLLPAMRRLDFKYRPSWGWDHRLKQTGSLAAWVVAYVLLAQIGLAVTVRVAYAADAAAQAIYTNAWMLLQVPYGILGVSLLTALMPRMSRAAADGRIYDLVSDLSLGSRLAAVLLLPVSALFTVFGGLIANALYAWSPDNESGAVKIGLTLSVSAFGLLPFAITMLQMRVFYALADSRTPALIQLIATVVKIPLLLACGMFLPSGEVVLGLAAVNALSFVVGGFAGQILLRRRLGSVRSKEVLATVASSAAASLIGALIALGVVANIELPDAWPVPADALVSLIIGLLIAAPTVLAAMRLLHVREADPAIDLILRRSLRWNGRLTRWRKR